MVQLSGVSVRRPGGNLGVQLSRVWAVSVRRPGGNLKLQLLGVWAASERRPGGNLGLQLSGMRAVSVRRPGGNLGPSGRVYGLCLYGDLVATWGSGCWGYVGSASVDFIWGLYLLFLFAQGAEERRKGEEGLV